MSAESRRLTSLSGEGLWAVPLRSGTRQGCLLFATSIQHSIERVFRQEKAIKGIHIAKEEVKLSLYAADTILYVEKPKDSTKLNF